jgi:hypothetical protein
MDVDLEIVGDTSTYRSAEETSPTLEIHFCPRCANVVGWKGLIDGEDGLCRAAVNARLAPQGTYSHASVVNRRG